MLDPGWTDKLVTWAEGGGALGALTFGWKAIKALTDGRMWAAERAAKAGESAQARMDKAQAEFIDNLQEDQRNKRSENAELRKRLAAIEADCHRHEETARLWEEEAHLQRHGWVGSVQTNITLWHLLEAMCAGTICAPDLAKRLAAGAEKNPDRLTMPAPLPALRDLKAKP